ncbi:hypothetical protein [Vibrio sp. WXL210]|uniref:hypothetical protein n=1 Tax=Vibrio sp. WXL210 TaxID=3450709 RepID=UPI003EC7ACFA
MKRYIGFLCLFFIVACSSDNDSDSDSDTQEPEARVVWRLNQPYSSYFISMPELEEDVNLIELVLAPSGYLCWTRHETPNWTLLQGDPEVDDLVTIQFLNSEGNTFTGEYYRSELDLNSRSLCDSNHRDNGVYKAIMPTHHEYWVLMLPYTTGYYWEESLGCYAYENIPKWNRGHTSVDSDGRIEYGVEMFDSEGGLISGHIERNVNKPELIEPICQ